MRVTKRTPAVAGMFYSENPVELRHNLSELIVFTKEKIEAKGVVVPHAGYMYSGWVAGKVYGAIEPPQVAIILGPNHTGLGDRASIFAGESFITPLGEVKVEISLVEILVNQVEFLSTDPTAHIHEHSIEVQVPFLQYINPDVKIVPICLGRLSFEEILTLGDALYFAVSQYPGKVLLVASTDFSHYVPHEVAKQKDSLAIEAILKLSEEELIKVVVEEGISMCGVIPTAVVIRACKGLGAKKAILIDYMTSGDVIKDYHSVVGYGGIVIY
ncbi:MAG: AmmeMemoRadiSam system protein B [Thermodesulfobacteria bacterium]|nr:AmmeMemoRadiSam system protein B [Thermodesulfobacteriota bacterium]